MAVPQISTNGPTEARERRRPDWRWLLASGVLAMALGVAGLGLIPVLTLVGVLSLGLVLLGAALYQAVQAWRGGGPGGRAVHVGLALAYGIGGLAIVASPPGAAIGLTLAIAAALVVVGFRNLMGASGEETPSRRRLGLAALGIGSLVFITWPMSSVWAIGLTVVAALLASGWRNLVGAIALRRSHPIHPERPERPADHGSRGGPQATLMA